MRPAQAAELRAAALELGRRAAARRARPVATSSPSARGQVAHRGARLLEPGRSRSTRFIDTCARPREASSKPERPHARQPAVALAHLAGDRARASVDVVAVELSSSPRPAAGARRPPSRPAAGAARRARGPAPGCTNASRRSVRERTPPRDRRRRRGTRARPSSSATQRREARSRRVGRARRGPRRARRTARRRARRAAGARPSWSRDVDVLGRRPRASDAPRVSASRRPGPASVNTDRWWSGSACTSSSDAPHAAGERVEHVAVVAPPTRSARTRAPVQVTDRRRRGSRR